MITIYSNQVSERLRYACHVIFKCVLLSDFDLTDDLDSAKGKSGPVINYSSASLPGSLAIPVSSLTTEKGVCDFEPAVGEFDGCPCLFPGKGDLPFDIFSASLYMVARYEEYLPYKADRYGRFLAEDSLAFRNGFLDRPVVDEWAIQLKKLIVGQWRDSQFPERRYSYMSTVDVDSAFAYKHKGFMRTLGGFAKDIIALDFGNATRRFKTVLGFSHDVFDTYGELIRLHQKYEVPGSFFFLLADYGMNDKNVPHTSQKFRQTVKLLDDYFQSGIHPGFMSNSEPERLKTEIGRLSAITHRKITHSRQHFLCISMPETYMRLLEEGIEHDYSMGFASQVGFRMGTCTAVPFYNLRTEQMTPLMLHPFQVMDATLNRYLELNAEEAMAVVENVVEKVKQVNGTFISLWHNESISDEWHWKGWRDFLERVMKVAGPEA